MIWPVKIRRGNWLQSLVLKNWTSLSPFFPFLSKKEKIVLGGNTRQRRVGINGRSYSHIQEHKNHNNLPCEAWRIQIYSRSLFSGRIGRGANVPKSTINCNNCTSFLGSFHTDTQIMQFSQCGYPHDIQYCIKGNREFPTVLCYLSLLDVSFIMVIFFVWAHPTYIIIKSKPLRAEALWAWRGSEILLEARRYAM